MSARDPLDLASLLGVEPTPEAAAAGFNVAPTTRVPVVVAGELTSATWGLAAGPTGSVLFNVRSETLRSRPAFATRLAHRRCIIPADGYYEWADAGGRRQPYYLTPGGGGLLAFAGVYDGAGPGRRCAILTGASSGAAAWLHHRAPLVVPADAWAEWLDPAEAAAGPELLQPATDLDLAVRRVGPAVNSATATGARLLDPVPADLTLW